MRREWAPTTRRSRRSRCGDPRVRMSFTLVSGALTIAVFLAFLLSESRLFIWPTNVDLEIYLLFFTAARHETRELSRPWMSLRSGLSDMVFLKVEDRAFWDQRTLNAPPDIVNHRVSGTRCSGLR